MNSQEIASLLTVVVAGILSLANLKGWLPQQLNALAAAVLGALSQLILVVLIQKPELSNSVSLILNVVVAVLVSLGAVVSTPKTVIAQAKSLALGK